MKRSTVSCLPVLFGLVALLVACGGPQIIFEEAAPTAPEAAAPADPLGGFRGDRAELGTEIELRVNPVGLPALGVVIKLLSAEWTEVEGRDGDPVREGTATILLVRGDDTKELRIDQGDESSGLGALVKVLAADESYDEERLDYTPRARVIVTAAP